MNSIQPHLLSVQLNATSHPSFLGIEVEGVGRELSGQGTSGRSWLPGAQRKEAGGVRGLLADPWAGPVPAVGGCPIGGRKFSSIPASTH